MSYRPYDRASRAMHRVLGSMEMADTLLRVCGFANRDAPAADAETKTKTKTTPNAEETFAASPSRRLDASAAESPLRSPARTRRGVVVEKASIDEVFVQLPSGCSLATHAAPCARAIRRAVAEKTGLVLSVGAARNKTLAKFASAAAKPDGVVVVAEQEDEQEDAGGNKDTSIKKNVRSRELEFVSESALLCSTPCSKLRGLGNARVAERMRDALRWNRRRRRRARRPSRRRRRARRVADRRRDGRHSGDSHARRERRARRVRRARARIRGWVS